MRELYVKELAWNHDSKRQIYLTTDLSAFNLFPCRVQDAPALPLGIEGTRKKKPRGGNRLFGFLDFHWLLPDGATHRVSQAKLIYYPQYPEVRLSGFIRGSKCIPSEYLREKSGEVFENRLLFLGVTPTSQVYGLLAVGQDTLRNEVRSSPQYNTDLALNRLELLRTGQTNRDRLLSALKSVHEEGWTTGRRLSGTEVIPTSAPQAVGYTLEALLGIAANGDNEPDYEGYEIKAMTVTSFESRADKAVTLMTPEPDLGVYHSESVLEFVRRWGYEDQRGRSDRRNFGGVYRAGVRHDRTKLTLTLVGYRSEEDDRFDADGYLALLSDEEVIAAGWTFQKLLQCWTRKHNAAAYVPTMSKDAPKRFKYGPRVLVCEGTDFLLVLRALASGSLYLDPAIKAEQWSSNSPKIKRRNQFRMKRSGLQGLYQKSSFEELSGE